jgi:ribosomal protein S12 methylthiotransferase
MQCPPPLIPTFCSYHPGFPGESDEAHRELVDYVREFKFERMGAFVYSEEDGTPAADLPQQTPQRIR